MKHLSLTEQVGKNIRMARKMNDWSAKEVAEAVGRSEGGFYRLENGTNNINMELLEKLSLIFDIPPTDFFNKEKIEKKQNNRLWGEIIDFAEEKGLSPKELKKFIEVSIDFFEKKPNKVNNPQESDIPSIENGEDTVSGEVDRLLSQGDNEFTIFKDQKSIFYAKHSVFSDKLFVIKEDGSIVEYAGEINKTFKKINKKTSSFKRFVDCLNGWQKGLLTKKEIRDVFYGLKKQKKEN